MYDVRWQYTILFRSAVSISRECIRKNFACERQFAVARDQRDYVKNHHYPGIIALASAGRGEEVMFLMIRRYNDGNHSR